MDRRAELEVLPAGRQFGLGMFPYFPLNNGLLTGKYSPQGGPKDARLSHVRQHLVAEADWEQLDRLAAFAQERGISEVDVAFGWLAAQQPIASVIAGATSTDQVQQNARALEYQMTQQDLDILDEIFPPVDKVALF